MNETRTISERRRALLLVAAVVVYYSLADRMARGAALQVSNGTWFGVVETGLQLVFMLAGLLLAARLWQQRSWRIVGWELGATHSTEASPLGWDLGWGWGTGSLAQLGSGAALGWAMVVAMVLPCALFGGIRVTLDWSGAAWGQLFFILLTTALGAALRQTVWSGFALRRLCDALGMTAAVTIVALFAGLVMFREVPGSWRAVLTVMLFQALCCVAALRTGSLWVGAGIDFASRIVLGAVLGFPVLGATQYSSTVSSVALGPAWLSGDLYGPAAGVLAPLVVLAAIYVVVRATRPDVIGAMVAGGIPMDIAERHAPGFPAAPAAAAAGTSLVQIGAPPVAPEIPLPPKPGF